MPKDCFTNSVSSRKEKDKLIKQSSKTKRNDNEDENVSLWLDYLIEPSMLEKFTSYCKNLLENGIFDASLRKMSNVIITNADSIWSDIKADAPEFDCRKGCSWCCHQSVSVTWPEILNIINYLKEKLKKKQIKFLKK